MNGANVPYQLRPNKFVERHLFLDVLDFVRVWNGPSIYVYASMGGRFLEDFKLINERFAIEQMISIEIDETAWKRQEFNCPLGFIRCHLQSSGEFITNFDRITAGMAGARFIVWLDYTAASDRGVQLQEYQELISKLTSGDVVKITLNANYQSQYKRKNYQRINDFEKLAVIGLGEQLGDYAPNEGITTNDLHPERFAKLLAKSVKIAALKGTESDLGIAPRPLASYRYQDGLHQMLTVTAIITDDTLSSRVTGDALFQQWDLHSAEWEEVHEINIPDLSQKERDYINHLVSTDEVYHIHENLPFRLDVNNNKSLESFRNYIKHYRRYPNFGRVYI